MNQTDTRNTIAEPVPENGKKRKLNVRLGLILYDAILFTAILFIVFWIYKTDDRDLLSVNRVAHAVAAVLLLLLSRLLFRVYSQVWRYGDMRPYAFLIFADIVSGLIYVLVDFYLLHNALHLKDSVAWFSTLGRRWAVAVFSVDLVAAILMRMAYRFLYSCLRNTKNEFLHKAFFFLTRVDVRKTGEGFVARSQKIRIAIVGAGRVGFSLAEELRGNNHAAYLPVCFIDINPNKTGRTIMGLPVFGERDDNTKNLRKLGVQEIVLALPNMDPENRRSLYTLYSKTLGYKVKVYDYPTLDAAETGRRHMREFDIDDLLFRKQIDFVDDVTSSYYAGKKVLITGGGGSIGSELCRQIARMKPAKLIILDVYENGAYDIQQDLRIRYKNKLEVFVEIVSVCDRAGLERVFAEYRPDIVLHAAAHKHVPLMEKNCCEAVQNNVFGTLNTVEMTEKYGAGRFIMVSTDKAVNPTNVMGATKRMCEMIVLSRAKEQKTTVYSATRFGNVLGSAGSVIPLFKRQIANGGPVTVTDKRVIRYFMTIPEASQLVLQSGRMAKSGELFVLDMGKPVRIYDLAENIIRLSGYEVGKDIRIVETGLRPGEKLYEELLIRSEELDKTENSLIFIERDTPLSSGEIEAKLEDLRAAVLTGDDATVKEALRKAVPTFRSPEEVNGGGVVLDSAAVGK